MANDMRARPISAKYLRPSSKAPVDSVTTVESSVDSSPVIENGKSNRDRTMCVVEVHVRVALCV